MAEQSIPITPDPEEVPKPEGAEDQPAKKPLLPPVLVRYSIVGGILAVLAGGAVFVVTDVIAPRVRSIGTESAAGGVVQKKPAKAKHSAPGEVFALSDIVINPAGTGGRRYLKVAAAIEVHEAKAAKELEMRKAQIRDLLIRDLSARTLEELTDPVAKEEMRTTIVSELNEILTAGTVANLYFTEYVVQ
jgi:flagellar protein FliL